MVTIRQHTLPEFRAYLQGYRDQGALLYATFLHHCWQPTAPQYHGLSTIEGIRYSQMHRDPPMNDIACGAYTAPDGTVFNGRPPTSNNCACQAPPKGVDFADLPAELRSLISASGESWRSWPNKYGFGVETIGCFDWDHPGAPKSEDPATSMAMRTSLDVLAMVHELWAIPVEYCFFHRDVSPKTCPGERVTKAWVHSELRRRLAVPEKPFRVDLLGTYLPADAAELRGGETWVRLHDVAEVAGWELFWRPDLNKVFVKSREA